MPACAMKLLRRGRAGKSGVEPPHSKLGQDRSFRGDVWNTTLSTEGIRTS